MNTSEARLKAAAFLRDMGQAEYGFATVSERSSAEPRTVGSRDAEQTVEFEDGRSVTVATGNRVVSALNVARHRFLYSYPWKAVPLLSQSALIERALQVMGAAGVTDDLQLFSTDLVGSTWYICFSRMANGFPYLGQIVCVALDEETGIFVSLSVGFTTLPVQDTSIKLPKSKAIAKARAVLSGAGIDKSRLIYCRPWVVPRNAYWSTGSEDQVGGNAGLAWVCGFSAATKRCEVWVSTTSNDILGGNVADVDPADPEFTPRSPSGDIFRSLGARGDRASELGGDFRRFTFARLRKQPAPQRTESAEHLLLKGVVFDEPDFWQLINDPGILLRASEIMPEPYSTAYLDALEAKLTRFPEPYHDDYKDDADSQRRYAYRGDGVQAAAILYRYGKRSGLDYLVDKLTHNASMDAGVVLAMNQDAAGLDGLAHLLSPDAMRKAVSIQSSLSPDGYQELFFTVAGWEDGRIRKVSLAYLTPNASLPMEAVALAALGDRDGLPFAERGYLSTTMDELKTYRAVVVAKFGGGDLKNDAVQFLRDHIAGKQLRAGVISNEDPRTLPIDLSGYLRLDDLQPELIDIVDKYRTPTVSPPLSSPRSSSYNERNRLEVAVRAAEALAKMRGSASLEAIDRLLRDIRKNNAGVLPCVRVARVYRSLGGSDEVVAGIMGKKWLAREEALSRLKKLPQYMLLSDHLDPSLYE